MSTLTLATPGRDVHITSPYSEDGPAAWIAKLRIQGFETSGVTGARVPTHLNAVSPTRAKIRWVRLVSSESTFEPIVDIPRGFLRAESDVSEWVPSLHRLVVYYRLS